MRSSAIDEDGDAHSFAGQHETFLNVEGIDAIAEAVVLCFASAFTARALDYRLHVGLPVDHIGLAILVQAQVPPTAPPSSSAPTRSRAASTRS